MNSECIFCKIIAKQVPSTIIDETDDLLVIKDIYPKASIHYLIIPKKHISNVRDFSKDDRAMAGDMILMAQKLSQEIPDPKAFRLIMNNGPEAGQCVFHAHMHFLAGHRLPGF
jgi:histidine triad (HIT) family protein